MGPARTGERTFSTIANRAGAGTPIPSGTLSPILANLIAMRVVAVDLPLSTRPGAKNKRYRVADPYLRFWLAFLQRGSRRASAAIWNFAALSSIRSSRRHG